MEFRPIIIASLRSLSLAVAGFLVPVAGQIAMLFMPVPLITVAVLHGRRSGILAALLTASAAALLGNFHAAVILLVLSLVLLALAIGDGMLRNLRHETTVLLGALVPIALLLLLFLPVLLKSGKDPFAAAEQFLRASIAETREIYVRAGLTDIVHTLDSLGDGMIHYAARLLPGILIATTLLQSLWCYGVARSIVLRKRPDLPLAARPPLAFWHLPDPWVWGLIATLALVAAAPRDSGPWFLGVNLSILWLLAYTAQGTALTDFLLRKLRIPVLMRSLLLALILTLPSVVIVIALGVVDIWADFRKVRVTEKG